MKPYLALLLLLLTGNAYGALNKWVDEEGNVHYSDVPPPPDVQNQTLKAPASSGPEQKSYTEREAEWKKAKQASEEAAQEAARKKENEQTRQRNCTGAKNNLKTLESNRPLTTYNEKGDIVNMDDAARQRSMEEARRQIGEYCGEE